MRRKTIAVDFDGVLHGYSRGWQGGVIYDPPKPGAGDALALLHQRFDLVIFTAREEATHEQVWAWLHKYNLAAFIKEVTNRKPMAAVYIDDRAIRFTSWDQALRMTRTVLEDDDWRPVQ